MGDLRFLRVIAGISQAKCARLSRIPRARIALFESGRLQLSPVEQAQIRIVLLKIIEAKSLQLQAALADSRAEGPGASV
jgi:transcriptional regulator with XRE-family HTH domain